jgi:D-3-phosphoglycerate dehydrogenase
MKKIVLALGAMQSTEMDILESEFHVIKLWKEKDPEATLQAHKLQVQVIVSTYNGMPVTKKIIEALPNLELIAQYGAGLNNIDVVSARARDIAVISTPDSPTRDTADTAIALILTTLRRVVEADMFVRVGKWNSGAFPASTSLAEKTVGICGFGRIGQAIAKRCSAFDMKVVYNSRSQKPDQPYQYYSHLKEMASHVDILVMACPGGDDTHHIANAAVFKALGSKGYFINIARGSVVNTEDLLVALSNRAIAGAGLDVYETEPSVPPALISMDNVVLLPHIGGGTVEARSNMGQLVIANIKAHFNGEPLISPVAA